MTPVASPIAFVAARFNRGPRHPRLRDQPSRPFGGSSQVHLSSGSGQPSHHAPRPSSSLKVFWVLHPLASQFNARIANNLVMFEPSALFLVLSLVCMLRPLQILTGIWTLVPPIT